MRSAVVLASLLSLSLPLAAACGDNDGGAGPASDCAPPEAALPEGGPLADPMELELTGCVPGGLDQLPGRWFVANLAATFQFEYPKFEGTCEGGFRRSSAPAIDTDTSDGRSFHAWSDGTRLWERRFSRFAIGDAVYEVVTASAYCMRADGTVAAAYGRFDSENGTSTRSSTGTRFGRKDEPEAKGLVKVGELGTRADGTTIGGLNVVVDQGTAYVASFQGLDIIDVRDPASPVHLALTPPMRSPGCNDVRVVRGAGRVVAFCAPYRGQQTLVIDVTTPAQPVLLAPIEEYSHSIFVRTAGERTLMYLATYTGAVPVYDVTNPAEPVRLGAPLVGADSDAAGIHDLFVDGDVVYANDTTGGLVVADISAGLDRPGVRKGGIPTTYSHASWVATIGGRKIAIHGDEGMTPDGGAFMRILDGDPASPTFLSELARYRTRPEVGIHNMMIVGDKAYISYYQDGVRVVDLSTPESPREVAHFNTWDPETAPGGAFEGAVGVRYHEGSIFVADDRRGLLILRPE